MATTQPHYDQYIHTKAIGELAQLPEAERETLKGKIAEASLYRHPLEHDAVVPLDGKPGLYRIRVADYRCILDKHLSQLRVLLVDKRAKVYDRLAVAQQRSMHE